MGEPPSSTSPNPTPECPADVPAPADLIAPPSRRARGLWYGGTLFLTSVLVLFGHNVYWLEGFKFLPQSPFVELRFEKLGLRAADFDAPLVYDEDVLLILSMVRCFTETGTHWHNDRMGCPGAAELSEWYPPGQELYDFPVIDHLHFAILWLLARFFSDVVVVYNLYYLLTYPLTALTAMAVLRGLKLTLPAAAVGGLLYAFLPYHYMRGESHYFLAAYWLIPLSLSPLFDVFRGDYPFFDVSTGKFRPFTRAALLQVLLAAATASAGAYYAFFLCVLYGAGGAYAWWMQRAWRTMASSGLVAAAVMAFGVVNHVPMYLHQAKAGKNPVADRLPSEADTYGMKIPQLVLPINDHNLTVLARWKARYNTVMRPVQNENEDASLGAIGSVGLVGLLLMFVFPTKRGWPFGPLAFLAGFMVLFSIVGGLGSLFNFTVFAQVRCYNRFSVVLAFVCLLAVLWPLDRFLLTRTGRARRLRYPAFALLAMFGIFDQTPFAWFGERGVGQMRKLSERYRGDQRFFAEIEATMPEGSRIFCLPYIPYPEFSNMNRMRTYDHARGYVHTRTLLWSYGAMKNREADAWARHLAFHQSQDRSAGEILNWLVYRGFDGVVLDTRGFDFTKLPNGDSVNAGLVFSRQMRQAAPPAAPIRAIVHPDDPEQLFLDLRAYRDWLRGQDSDRFAAEEKRIREWPAMTWLEGFYTYNPLCETTTPIWAAGQARAAILNPSHRTRMLEVNILFGVDSDGQFDITIDAPALIRVDDGQRMPLRDAFPIDRPPPKPHELGPDGRVSEARVYALWKTYRLEVPPGRSFLTFTCKPPPLYVPHDHRPVYYFIKDFVIVEPGIDPVVVLAPDHWRHR